MTEYGNNTITVSYISASHAECIRKAEYIYCPYWGVYWKEKAGDEWGFTPAKWKEITISGKGLVKTVEIKSKTSSQYVVVEYTPKFTDVAKTAWYYDDVTAAKLLVRGTNAEGTIYSPESQVTRAEFITMVVRALRLPDVKDDRSMASAFSDVSASDWFYAYVVRANAAGLLNALAENGAIKPNQAITRE